MIGVHRLNRGGSLLDMVNVENQIKVFKGLGFSFAETRRAICSERWPGDEGDKQEQINIDFVDGTCLPPITKRSLLGFSWTCSHTNQAMRVMLRSEDAGAQRDALAQGIEWFHVR